MAESHLKAKVKSSSQVTLVNIPSFLPKNTRPQLTSEQRRVANVIDFLKGIVSREWTIERGTLLEKTFPTTGQLITRRLTDLVRDDLIASGWAYWNGESKKSGWSLAASPEEILKNITS